MMSHWIARYLGCHFGWHGNIMAPDHPKMILGVHRDRMHESKVSLDGFTIRNSQSSHPSLEYSILIATILKIPKTSRLFSTCSSGKRIVKAPECFLLDSCVCYCEVRVIELLLLSENKDTTGKIISHPLEVSGRCSCTDYRDLH